MEIFVSPTEIVRELTKANQLFKDVWRIWGFQSKNNTLILGGYKLPYAPDTFLIFHRTSRLDLKFLMSDALFNLRHSSYFTEDVDDSSAVSLSEGDYFIEIANEENHNFVICKGVSLLNVPTGAFV